MALTDQQNAAIQAAIQQASSQGGTGNSANQSIQSALQNSGLFTSDQIASLANDGITGNNQFTGAVPSGSWGSQVQNAIGSQATSTQVPTTQPTAATSPLQSALSQGYNPLQPQYLSDPTQLAPTLATAAQSNLQLSPDQTISQIMAAFQPQADRATTNLNNQLAAFGIAGGPALNEQNNLQNALSSGLGTSLAGAIQNTQGNMLQQSMNNANLSNQTGLANAGYSNTANQQNLSNILGTNQFNTNASNTANQNLYGYLNQGYNNQLGQFGTTNNLGVTGGTSLANTGLNGSNGLAQNAAGTFPIQSGGAAGAASLGNQLGQGYNQWYTNQQQQQTNQGVVNNAMPYINAQATTPTQITAPGGQLG